MEYHVCCSCSLFCSFPSPCCSLFSLLLATGKHFLLLFRCFVPRTCVTTTGYTSLDTLANFFVCFSNCLKFCVYEHGIPCDSEKNSDGWIKWECGILPFNNGKHISTTTMLMTTKSCRKITYHPLSHMTLESLSFGFAGSCNKLKTSPLPHCLWPPDLRGWWLIRRCSHP